MAALKRRHNRWEAKVRIPRELEKEHGGRTHLYRTIRTADKRTAKAEAEAWEVMLRAEWAEKLGHGSANLSAIRAVYERVRQEAVKGELQVISGEEDPVLLGVDHEIDKLAEEVGQAELTATQAARLAALQDAAKELQNQPVEPRPELELSFGELARSYVDWWKRQSGLKETNRERQKRATFNLFAGFWGERPIRGVRKPDAARFMDELRTLDPSWGRSPKARVMGWAELMRRFGGAATGPAPATLNRHAADLQTLWEWAADRGHCEGRNPFAGFHRKLRQGVNVQDYRPWTVQELEALFSPLPKRTDLKEIILVGMFTGMRLDEIASMRWAQLQERAGVRFIAVEDAKTRAGERDVPLHPELTWLWERTRGADEERVWPSFNPEGPGKKAGADAGREFSRFKTQRGFTDRRKVFHSFRKNVVGQLEAKGVLESEVAEIVGHAKGFTFGRYGSGIPLERKAEIISLIGYPELELPHPTR